MPVDHSGDVASPQASILRITGQLLPARCIAIATELGLPDHLARSPMQAEALADKCGVHGPSLFRILRFLASIGIFSRAEDGSFHNTPKSEVLRPNVEGSIYPLVRQGWQDLVWDTYRILPEALKSGEPAFLLAYGKPFFEHLSSHLEHSAMFDESMALMSSPENDVIANTYPFGDAKTVMDIGGGRGGLLAVILSRHNALAGILFDQEHVIEHPDAIVQPSLEGRYRTLAGDFFDSVPEGADLYLLKRILHDWSDDDAVKILTCVRKALSPDARVAVIDAVIKPGNDADPNKYLDVGIMTLLNGRERTAEEFGNLFAAAGLQVLRILPTEAPSTLSIIEGKLA